MEFPSSLNRWQVAYNNPIRNIYHLYTTYILLPIGLLYATYHLLREPETAIGLPKPMVKLVNQAIRDGGPLDFHGNSPPIRRNSAAKKFVE